MIFKLIYDFSRNNINNIINYFSWKVAFDNAFHTVMRCLFLFICFGQIQMNSVEFVLSSKLFELEEGKIENLNNFGH